MRKFFAGGVFASGGSDQSMPDAAVLAMKPGRRTKWKRYGMSDRTFKIRMHALASLFWIPAAWGLCFGFMFTLSRNGFSAPYDWMKAAAAPMADALAPFFPAIDNVTRNFHAHGYGGRAEFGRCVAGMTMFFMAASICLCPIYWLTIPKRARLQIALQSIKKLSPIKNRMCFFIVYVMIGHAAFEIGAGDMLLDWDDPHPGRFSRMTAIQETDWVAGMTMFIGANCGLALTIALFVLDAIWIGKKRKKSGKRSRKKGAVDARFSASYYRGRG